MPGFPPSGRHDDNDADASPSEEVKDEEPLVSGEETQQDGSWIQDGDLQGCERLERRWVLWHEFMREHAHLDAWLRLAERAAGSPGHAHVTFATAADELRKFERLQCEAGVRLVQLDSLTRRNRTLLRLFEGAMRARLLAAARDCGQRWDDVNARLETIAGRLKLFVSEWEEFEAEREELALWLADLDVRLTEVDHLTGSTCDKLRRLQSFQQCVCVNSARVNALLRRGEALIQRGEPSDAQRVERRLLELLRRCSVVCNNITRTHTRLLSMKLVFEDDWILSQASDSGCPSESLLEDEVVLDPRDPSSPAHLPPPPSPPSSPTHEHLGLEWDPSVDIGRSVSPDDADSSYFSVGTGLCLRDGVKRRSFLSSQSDITDDDQEAEQGSDGWLSHAHPAIFSPPAIRRATSTPDGEPLSFDGGGRVRAWLGVQSPAPPERRRTSCSRAVQTDDGCVVMSHLDGRLLLPGFPPRVLNASSDWLQHRRGSDPPAAEEEEEEEEKEEEEEEERSCCGEAERLLSEQSRPSSPPLSPALLSLLLAAALALLAALTWTALEPPCHRGGGGGRTPRGLHLALRYVNGPPPT